MNDLTGAAANHAPSDSTLAQPMIALAGTELHLASASGNVNILRGIDLTVARGEKVGVVGELSLCRLGVSHGATSGSVPREVCRVVVFRSDEKAAPKGYVKQH